VQFKSLPSDSLIMFILIYSSTHNTQIERVWLEVGQQFAQRWKAFFEQLEERYSLDAKDPHHLWLLVTLFLDDINEDVKEFVETFNSHSVKNTEQGSMSPKVWSFLISNFPSQTFFNRPCALWAK
jgi:hypothetical protein